MRVRFGECVLDADTRQLFVRGAEVHLQPKAFQFLELLIQNRPRVVPKTEIHEKLWPGTFVSDGTLTSLLAEVREAIGDDARQPHFVRTAHRVGYAFSGEAIEVHDRLTGHVGGGPTVWLLRGKNRIALESGETIIGRDPGAAVHIDDPSVSRRHARIVVSEAGATLEDLGSKNGTHVGEVRIQKPMALSDGLAVKIGSVPLLVRLFETPQSTVTSVEPES
jgi:DNA-binding winged helix-turn-helix (wHTH) protein